MGLFSKIKKGLLKTKQQMVSKIALLLNSFTKIDEDLFEQILDGWCQYIGLDRETTTKFFDFSYLPYGIYLQ